tara:strand:+ start:208 stop:324 length:117 start_codon:yes stop_codon:yes gene_type:complete
MLIKEMNKGLKKRSKTLIAAILLDKMLESLPELTLESG